MKLILQRKWATEDSTIGELSVDGVFACYTLEDVVRDNGEKVPGKTAIPSGQYNVIVNQSKRFGRLMPLLLNVPNFEGVRIHSGNTSQDTEGCILLGRVREENRIGESKLAFDSLFPKIQSATSCSIQVLDSKCEGSSVSTTPNLEVTSTQASPNDFLKSIIALIASLLGNVLPQPKQP